MASSQLLINRPISPTIVFSWDVAVSSASWAREIRNTFSISTVQVTSGITPTARNAAISFR